MKFSIASVVVAFAALASSAVASAVQGAPVVAREALQQREVHGYMDIAGITFP
ncbi:hypothetical protein CPC08DRAFT_708064 [Agrocybe pediades]|nr:hypothetical protein CPC08DRAFT_708064 [Agrocybe pediades]